MKDFIPNAAADSRKQKIFGVTHDPSQQFRANTSHTRWMFGWKAAQTSLMVGSLLPVFFLLTLHTLSVTLATAPLHGRKRFIPTRPSGQILGFSFFVKRTWVTFSQLLYLISRFCNQARNHLEWGREGAFTPTDFSPFKKSPSSFFLHPLVWFVSTGVKASITHGCIPKHSDRDHQK